MSLAQGLSDSCGEPFFFSIPPAIIYLSKPASSLHLLLIIQSEKIHMTHLQASTNELDALCRLAQLSNTLAKRLTGQTRTLAYRIKAEACSLLIVAGSANVNGIWPGGIVALDLFGNPPLRLHIRRSHLSRQARKALDTHLGSVPAVSRLGDSVHIRRRAQS